MRSSLVPRKLEFRQCLPKSLIGKVLRGELRAGETVHENRGKHASWLTFKAVCVL
jgi:acyl-coenzyme A synthetase/AMP-(fatty) acid ligase